LGPLLSTQHHRGGNLFVPSSIFASSVKCLPLDGTDSNRNRNLGSVEIKSAETC
jgi:hypothetical protein